MESIHTVNEIEWINNHLQSNGLIDMEQVQCISSFSLLWNLFEGHVCGQNASIRNFENITKNLDEKGLLVRKDFDIYLSYYRDRYVSGGKMKSIFNGLRFRPNDRKDLVENVLLGKDDNLSNIVLSLLIIVYRLKNNLFHCIKSLYNINDQLDNFRKANRILMKIVELAKI